MNGRAMGLDMEAALAFARAAGHDLAATTLLLPIAEAGIIAGLASQEQE